MYTYLCEIQFLAARQSAVVRALPAAAGGSGRWCLHAATARGFPGIHEIQKVAERHAMPCV